MVLPLILGIAAGTLLVKNTIGRIYGNSLGKLIDYLSGAEVDGKKIENHPVRDAFDPSRNIMVPVWKPIGGLASGIYNTGRRLLRDQRRSVTLGAEDPAPGYAPLLTNDADYRTQIEAFRKMFGRVERWRSTGKFRKEAGEYAREIVRNEVGIEIDNYELVKEKRNKRSDLLKQKATLTHLREEAEVEKRGVDHKLSQYAETRPVANQLISDLYEITFEISKQSPSARILVESLQSRLLGVEKLLRRDYLDPQVAAYFDKGRQVMSDYFEGVRKSTNTGSNFLESFKTVKDVYDNLIQAAESKSGGLGRKIAKYYESVAAIDGELTGMDSAISNMKDATEKEALKGPRYEDERMRKELRLWSQKAEGRFGVREKSLENVRTIQAARERLEKLGNRNYLEGE